MSPDPVLSLTGVTKDFPGVRALASVSLDLHRGEILGLVGENGAGKSTLLKILGGIHPAGSFEGTIQIGGAERRFSSAAEGLRAGVAVVHQELSLVPEMSVAENLFLGREPARFGLLCREELCAAARELLEQVVGDEEIDPEAPAGRLGVGRQQLVEIARALGADAHVVVLDEPTAALTEREAARLFDLLRAGTAAGTSFMYVSHRLEEIFELCDRVAVLRDGRLVAVRFTADTSPEEIVELMTGASQDDLLEVRSARSVREPGPVLLRVEHLSLEHPEHPGRRVLDHVSLHVRAGEVVALAGAMGSGRTALLSTLFGLARGRLGGRVLIDGDPVILGSPAEAIAHDVALVPEDRKILGLVLGMSVADNLNLASLERALTDDALLARRAARSARELGVRAAGLEVDVGTLSGGNQQKVVLGKWLLTEPRVLLLDEPTRGVDVGARAEIHRIIRGLGERGVAVLMASSDPADLRACADRVLVLREGRLAGELTHEQATEAAIMALAIGPGEGALA